jgi:hypothetical protein
MKKKIVIKSKDDLEKFYKRFWLYRSFLYRNVTFVLKEDKYNISNFISALNIKNRRKRIEYIYDQACDEVDNYYVSKNMCGFKNNQCYVQRKLKNGKINGCCRMCIHQSKTGCKTKNLTCKLFFCSEVKKRYKVLGINDINIIKLLTKRQRYILSNCYFTSKKEVLNDLYIGSIMIVLFRYCYRIVRNIFIRKLMNRDKI